MRSAFLIIVFTLISGIGAYARLGETIDQCRTRYGKEARLPKAFDRWDSTLSKMYGWFFDGEPTEGLLRSADILAFGEGEITVFVAFWNGRSFKELYMKRDHTVFSDEEVRQFRNANGKDATWKNSGQMDAPLGSITVYLILQFGAPKVFKTDTGIWSCSFGNNEQVLFILAAPLVEISETPQRIENERKKGLDEQLKRF